MTFTQWAYLMEVKFDTNWSLYFGEMIFFRLNLGDTYFSNTCFNDLKS